MAKRKSTEKIDKKAEAKSLFMLEKFDQKKICALLGIAQNTFTRWKREGSWDSILEAQTGGKDRFAAILLEQITALDDSMQEGGRKLMTSTEINSLYQLHGMLRRVETEGSITATVNVMIQFTEWMSIRYPSEVKLVTKYSDEFIQEQLAQAR